MIDMLELVPITLAEANTFVERNHRHHGAVVGHKYSIGVSDGEKIVGVVIVGRPVSRHLDNGWTLEATRDCSDGHKNAPSKLLRAAWRVAINLGYRRLITYTLKSESGSSTKGAGFRLVGERGGGNWNVPSRPRVDTPAEMQQPKLLWELTLDRPAQHPAAPVEG